MPWNREKYYCPKSCARRKICPCTGNYLVTYTSDPNTSAPFCRYYTTDAQMKQLVLKRLSGKWSGL